MSYQNVPNGEILQTVEPERHPLRWLWWLLAAAILGGIIWALAWACTRPEPIEVIDPVAPIATINPTDAPPVDPEPEATTPDPEPETTEPETETTPSPATS